MISIGGETQNRVDCSGVTCDIKHKRTVRVNLATVTAKICHWVNEHCELIKCVNKTRSKCRRYDERRQRQERPWRGSERRVSSLADYPAILHQMLRTRIRHGLGHDEVLGKESLYVHMSCVFELCCNVMHHHRMSNNKILCNKILCKSYIDKNRIEQK